MIRMIRIGLTCVFLMLSLSVDVSAAYDEVEPCIAVGKAHDIVLYRCEDWQASTICYMNSIGLLFCLPE